ncbi:hypothetical protein BH18THE2_BH18THE2_05710 [soil metagenome]
MTGGIGACVTTKGVITSVKLNKSYSLDKLYGISY